MANAMQGTAPATQGAALARLVPGIALCLAITAIAYGLQFAQSAFLGRAWLEALVVALVLGTVARSIWTLPQDCVPGIDFSARTLLEIAVVLLGVSISASTMLAAGIWLPLGIAGTVCISIVASFAIGRMLGLPARMAILIASGNSVCGNSAIAAVAPVIGAKSDDVAASIGFTAVLGVLFVLGLPLVCVALGLTVLQSGALAGLTVYAVPQVLAAAAPLGSVAVQMGTLVKLIRVLMLGPLCVVLALIAPRLTRGDGDGAAARPKGRTPLHQFVPWFIVGFILLAALRSFGLIPMAVIAPANEVSGFLTVVAMAALGLGVDVRSVASAGIRVTSAVVLSLAVLFVISLVLIHSLALG